MEERSIYPSSCYWYTYTNTYKVWIFAIVLLFFLAVVCLYLCVTDTVFVAYVHLLCVYLRLWRFSVFWSVLLVCVWVYMLLWLWHLFAFVYAPSLWVCASEYVCACVSARACETVTTHLVHYVTRRQKVKPLSGEDKCDNILSLISAEYVFKLFIKY